MKWLIRTITKQDTGFTAHARNMVYFSEWSHTDRNYLFDSSHLIRSLQRSKIALLTFAFKCSSKFEFMTNFRFKFKQLCSNLWFRVLLKMFSSLILVSNQDALERHQQQYVKLFTLFIGGGIWCGLSKVSLLWFIVFWHERIMSHLRSRNVKVMKLQIDILRKPVSTIVVNVKANFNNCSSRKF